jgi:hypothetical protein
VDKLGTARTAPIKLLRYGRFGREQPGLLDGQGVLRDLSTVVADIAGTALSTEGLERLRALDPNSLPVVAGYLQMWLTVNGRRFQSGNTGSMVFDVAYLVSHISRYMTLMPGDVISTGTPPGVGHGQKPPLYLNAGDVVELGIEVSASSANT